MIIKKDGRREEFNRDKIRSGITKACEKRNVSMNSIEDFLDELEQELRETGKKVGSEASGPLLSFSALARSATVEASAIRVW